MIKKNWWRENNVLRFDFPLQLNNRFSQFSFLSLSLFHRLSPEYSLSDHRPASDLFFLYNFSINWKLKKNYLPVNLRLYWFITRHRLYLQKFYVSNKGESFFFFLIYYLFWNFSWFYSLILFNSPQIIKKMNKKNVISE